MKISLETALLSHLTRARAFGHNGAEWLATRVLASRNMNEAQVALACMRLETMLNAPGVVNVRATRNNTISVRAILTQGDY